MRYFQFRSKNCCAHKTSYIRNEVETVKDARSNIDNAGGTSLEEWCGIKWNEEEQGWERELTHEEALHAALSLDSFGDFNVREFTAWDILDGILDLDSDACDDILADVQTVSDYAFNGNNIVISDNCALLLQYVGELMRKRIREGEIPSSLDWFHLEKACRAIPLT